MNKKATATIDAIVALQRTLDAGELEALRLKYPRLDDPLKPGKYPGSSEEDSTEQQDKSAFAIHVLEFTEATCETVLRRALGMIRLQRRVRRVAELATLVSALTVIGALTSDHLKIAMVATVAILVASAVKMLSEYLKMAPGGESVSPQVAYVRVSHRLMQVVAVRAELQISLHHQRRERTATELHDAVERANALFRSVVEDGASLLADPNGSAWHDRPVGVPLQA